MNSKSNSRTGRVRGVGIRSRHRCEDKHFYDHLLPSLTMPGCTADEVVLPWLVELHGELAGVGEQDWMVGVALLVLLLIHHHHRILLVLKSYTGLHILKTSTQGNST